jgi:hypothetical protein
VYGEEVEVMNLSKCLGIALSVIATAAPVVWAQPAKTAGMVDTARDTALVCQQSKLVAQGALQLCLALNSANILKGAPDKSAACQQGLTNELALIDRSAAKAGTACRYVSNGDGTVSDLNTGLMWEQTTSTCNGEVTCYNDTYTWSNSGTAPDGGAFTSFLGTLNNGAGNPSPITGCFANHCDWRLPSDVELQGIFDQSTPGCGFFPYYPCIDPTFGPTQSSNYYWSATTFVDSTNEAWIVDFREGGVGTAGKSINYDYVRAVRGGL